MPRSASTVSTIPVSHHLVEVEKVTLGGGAEEVLIVEVLDEELDPFVTKEHPLLERTE